jgi:cystathionine beta-synthase
VGSILKTAKETGHITEGQPYKVEGIGGDKLPGTLDLSLVDEIRLVTDKEAFLMTRRLAREEGLFAGGSSGLAVVVALQVAREIDDPSAIVVVILPDTGERYLSKVHSDEWMTENRFMEQDEARARDLLSRKRTGATSLVSITSDRIVKQALALMNEHSVTQLPVIDGGECVGSVKEGALMARAIEDRKTLDASVGSVMDKPFPVVHDHDPMDHVLRLFTRENEAVLVRRAGRIGGILTRYDVIQHLSGR